jgi:hypothetical protein
VREICRGVEQLNCSQDNGVVGAVGEKRIRNNLFLGFRRETRREREKERKRFKVN